MNAFMIVSHRRALSLRSRRGRGSCRGGRRGAARPGQLTFPDEFVDSDTCAFAITGDTVFTNDIIDSSTTRGNAGASSEPVASHVTAKGTTLRVDVRETIFVKCVDGVAVTAKHVGLLNSIAGRAARSSSGRARRCTRSSAASTAR